VVSPGPSVQSERVARCYRTCISHGTPTCYRVACRLGWTSLPSEVALPLHSPRFAYFQPVRCRSPPGPPHFLFASGQIRFPCADREVPVSGRAALCCLPASFLSCPSRTAFFPPRVSPRCGRAGAFPSPVIVCTHGGRAVFLLRRT